MDNSILFPTPNSDILRKEIAKAFKLHCSLVDYKEGGCDIKDIINEDGHTFMKAGKAVVRTLKDSLITTNHIDRKNDIAIDFETDPVDYVNRNEYIQMIKDVDPELYNLIYNALNNGIFFRNASTRRSFNYWQPLSNAGIPAVPRPDAVHETTFLVHDILHNLIPDLQLSDNNELNKAVYIIHRVIGEGICLILADMYFVDALSKKVDYDFEKKNIYQAFKHIKNRDRFENVKANAIYAVTGNKEGFGTSHEEVEKYLEWFRPVYISDLKWTLNNISDISVNFNTHIKWLKWFKPFLNSKDYGVDTTGDLISRLKITKEDSILEITEKIFDFIYFIYFQLGSIEVESSTSEDRKAKAQDIYYAFQGRVFFDFESGESQEFASYYMALIEGKYKKAEAIYQSFIDKLYKEQRISDDDLRVYKEVYPHFNAYFISYNADVVVADTLKDYSEELFNKLLG